MRKTIALILTITMIFSLISCAKENVDKDVYISDYTDLSGVTISESRYNSAYLDYYGNIFLPILSETADERIDRSENNSLMLLSYDQVEEITSISTSEENRNIIIDNVCGTKDGSIVGFFNELYFSDEKNTNPMTGEEKDGITYSQTFFEKFAPDGEVVFRKNFGYDLPEPLTGLHSDSGEMIADDKASSSGTAISASCSSSHRTGSFCSRSTHRQNLHPPSSTGSSADLTGRSGIYTPKTARNTRRSR
ncbi:MAG: hypothetical protein PUG87_00860 [Eubacteriales bacterium]|nr:hypothetical protein [Eubacteriales bacterium]